MPNRNRGLDIDEKLPKQGINHLLVIAVNAYEHAPKLSNCVRDAQAFIDVLVSKYDFLEKNVIRLFDEEATKANIFRRLQKLRLDIKEEDNLLIYFAGHGDFDKAGGVGYLVPVEARPGEHWNFLSNEDFLSLIRSIRSFHTFLLMDSCFSGTLFRNIGDSSTMLAENVERFPSRWGLAAGMIEEVEDGWHGDNSPFAKAVLQYLETNKNAKFPVSELVQYVKRVIPRNAKQTPIGGPLFKVGDLDGEFSFHLKKDEAADWKKACETDNIEAYLLYLAVYPDGKHKAKAEQFIQRLKAAESWQNIQKAATENEWQIHQKIRLIDHYIDQFKGEKNYNEAIDLGELLEAQVEFLKAKNSKFALLRFVQKDTPFKQEGEKMLAEWNKREDLDAKRLQEERQREAALKKEEEARIQKEQREEQKKVAASMMAERERLQKEQIQKENKLKKEPAKQHIPVQPSFSAPKSHVNQPSFFQKYGKWIGLALLFLGTVFIIFKLSGGKEEESSLYPVKNPKGEFGYISRVGVMIKHQYTTAEKFKNGKAKVTRGQETFFINEKGDCVDNCPKMYRYSLHGKYAVKNASGKMLTDTIYDDVGFYGEGFIAVRKNDKWGYVNEKGAEAIPLIYDEVDYANGFVKGQSWVRQGNDEFYIDETGQQIKEDSSLTVEDNTVVEKKKKEMLPPSLDYTFSGDKLRITIKNGSPPFTIRLTKSGNEKFKKIIQADNLTINITSFRHDAGKYGIEIEDDAGKKDVVTVPIDAPEKEKSPVITTPSSSGTIPDDNTVFVQGGTFTMGCTSEQGSECQEDEKPDHQVKVNSFYLDKYEVTNAHFCSFLNEEGNKTEGGKTWLDISSEYCNIEVESGNYRPKSGYVNHPVVEVTWYGAAAYCKWRSKKTGKKYRLPTEAEWEYAARGGSKSKNNKYAGSNDPGSVAWYSENSGSKTHEVGKKSSNELGLYDMSGNVWEWCSDWYDGNYYANFSGSVANNPKGPSGGDYRVLRGGSWSSYTGLCRVSLRGRDIPNGSYSNLGFRCLRAD